MNVALRQPKRLNVAEFVELIRPLPDDERWELLDGVPVLMSPQSDRHQRIVMSLLRHADRVAETRGCSATPGLAILNPSVDDYAPIPDVVIRCGPVLDDGYANDPVFIAEVLSPSTMSNDRGRKLDFYKSIPTLQTLLIVYQDERRVETWVRWDGGWRYSVAQDATTQTASVQIPSLDWRLSLSDIYRGISFA